MSLRRQALLGASVLVVFVLLIKMGQVAMTPEFWDWTAAASVRIAQSPAVKFLVIVATLLWCAALFALAWERSTRRYQRREEERATTRRVREEMARAAMTGLTEDRPRPRPKGRPGEKAK